MYISYEMICEACENMIELYQMWDDSRAKTRERDLNILKSLSDTKEKEEAYDETFHRR